MNMQACSTILHVSPSEALSKEYIESYYGNQNLEAPCQLCRIHAILDKQVDMFLAVFVFFTIFYNERSVCLQVNPQNIHEYNYVFVFSTQHHTMTCIQLSQNPQIHVRLQETAICQSKAIVT